METTPRTILADSIAGFMPEPDEGQDGLVNLDRADDMIDALEKAGYSVIDRRTRRAEHEYTFDQLANGAVFADVYGRVNTKTSRSSARDEERVDTTHVYLELDDDAEDDLEDIGMWESGPFRVIGHTEDIN